MHMIAALDLATGKIFYRIRKRKRWQEFLDFLKTLRERWPDDRVPCQYSRTGFHLGFQVITKPLCCTD
jgi:hypothetical protein